MKFDFVTLINIADAQSWGDIAAFRKYEVAINCISKYLSHEEVTHFYTKDLFQHVSDKANFYVFTNNRLYICTINDELNSIIEVFKISDIESIRIYEKYDDAYDVELVITIKGSEHILNGAKCTLDTVKSNRSEFKEDVIILIKELISNMEP